MRKCILSGILCLCLGLMPAAVFAAGADAVKTVQLGASGISGWTETAGYDYLYYGTYNDTPVQWRVLDDATNIATEGLFLCSESLFQKITFGTNNSF